MAGIKISDQTAASSAAPGMILPVASGGLPFGVTVEQVASYATKTYEYTTGVTVSAALTARALASDLSTHTGLTSTAHGGLVNSFNGRTGVVVPELADYQYYAEVANNTEWVAALTAFAASGQHYGIIEVSASFTIAAGTLVMVLDQKRLVVTSISKLGGGSTPPTITIDNGNSITLEDSEIEFRSIGLACISSSAAFLQSGQNEWARVLFQKCTLSAASSALCGCTTLRQKMVVNINDCTGTFTNGYLVKSTTSNSAVGDLMTTKVAIYNSILTGRIASQSERWNTMITIGGGCKIIDGGAGCWTLTPGVGSATMDIVYDGLGSQVSLALTSGSSALTSTTNTANLSPDFTSLSVAGVAGGGLVINSGAVDYDVTINKATSGVAWKYDAGTDTQTVGAKIVAVSGVAAGNITFNSTAADFDFQINAATSGVAYKYDAGTAKHAFSGQTYAGEAFIGSHASAPDTANAYFGNKTMVDAAPGEYTSYALVHGTTGATLLMYRSGQALYLRAGTGAGTIYAKHQSNLFTFGTTVNAGVCAVTILDTLTASANVVVSGVASGNMTVNSGAVDYDFTVNKATSGTAIFFDAGNVALSLLGAATDKLGFFGATAVVQQATTGTVTGFSQVTGDDVTHASTFTGNSGTKAYTIGDIVLALKNYGLLAAS